MTKQKGFTLIELMVVVVIAAILVAIALPSYRQYVKRGNRRAAQAAMMDIVNKQQQFFVADRTYVADDGTGVLCTAVPAEVVDNYTCAVAVTTAGTVQSFTVTFAPTGTQAPDDTLTVNDQGAKTPSDKW
jgi:type IV pilus assembly protein PilE